MTDTPTLDCLLARADERRDPTVEVMHRDDDGDLIGELAVTLRYLRDTNRLLQGTNRDLNEVMRLLDDENTRLRAAARDVINEWNAGGEWIRAQFESTLTALASVIDAEVIDR